MHLPHSALLKLVIGLLILHAFSRASAQGPPEQARGTIVQIEEGHIFADTSNLEVSVGDIFDVYRRIEVKNPLTKKALVDYFVIGELRVVQTSDSLSWLGANGPASREPRVGDLIVPDGWVESNASQKAEEDDSPTESEGAEEVDDVSSSPADGAAQAGARASTQVARSVEETEKAHVQAQSADERELIEAWYATLGLSPKERIGIYRTYLRRNPHSRHRRAVQMAIDDLRAEQRRERRPGSRIDKLLGQRLTRTTEGAPSEVAFATSGLHDVRSAVLMVRKAGESDFVPIVMNKQDSYFRAAVPEPFVTAQGFEYYVQGVRADGTALPVVANPLRPQSVSVVRKEPLTAREDDRSAVRFVSELVNFNGFEGDDWYLRAEADFLYRTELRWLYSVRLGYGHVEGRGGKLEDYDKPDFEADEVRFTYGYIESEIQIIELLSVMGRLTIGLGQDQDGSGSGLRAGAQLRVRIGKERSTNLVIAGETIPELGQRAFVGLTWYASELFPVRAEVHVTDQPVNQDDLAVRGVLEFGWQGLDPIEIALRLSYQGRRIDHAGIGAGLTLGFNW